MITGRLDVLNVDVLTNLRTNAEFALEKLNATKANETANSSQNPKGKDKNHERTTR